MKKLLWIGLIIVILVGVKLYNRSDDQEGVLKEMKAVIAELGFSVEDTAYLNGVLDRVHPHAFDAAYSMGTRRRAATLSEETYIQDVFDRMIRACNSDGKTHLVEGLQKARDQILVGLRT